MAESLHDGEFWLPPQFLSDDDFIMDLKGSVTKNSGKKAGFEFETEPVTTNTPLFPFEFSYGYDAFGGGGHFSSDLSSPVESVVGSTETESDEEDFITGLTRQIAHSTLEDAAEKTKARVLSGSPQSTLSTVGSRCGCRQGSSRGSPNCQSRFSSPPETTWNMLYAAAGEVTRMRMDDESHGYHKSGGLLGPARKPSQISVPVMNYRHIPNLFDSSAGSIFSQQQHHKLQATQFQQLKQHQKHQQEVSSIWGGPQQHAQSKHNGLFQVGGVNGVMTRSSSANTGRPRPRPLGLSPSAWPPLQDATTQHQNGSGMRAVFVGGPAAKRECAGTGVFLPRRINIPEPPRKKSAGSSVMLPTKVVQSLNFNFDDKGTPVRPRFGSFTPECDAVLRSRNGGNGVSYLKQHNLRLQPAMNHHEIRLPQEWTY